ncbi:hypothetical protein [Microbacterium sp. 3J1]|uniref:hypothetical protein n=1 Tax=Microbacterium sp. 3J1 TaxID=861269 RepID=UPI000B176BA6|nr:hypothetical protein [Microbacterium sp. 3J1]
MSEPQQPPAQPYQGQPYPGQPQPGPPQPGPPLVALAISLVVTLAFPFIIRSLYETVAIGAVGAVGNGLVLVVAVVALILGLLAVRRPGQQILAGIAIGISASAIAGIVLSWLSNLAFALIYS